MMRPGTAAGWLVIGELIARGVRHSRLEGARARWSCCCWQTKPMRPPHRSTCCSVRRPIRLHHPARHSLVSLVGKVPKPQRQGRVRPCWLRQQPSQSHPSVVLSASPLLLLLPSLRLVRWWWCALAIVAWPIATRRTRSARCRAPPSRPSRARGESDEGDDCEQEQAAAGLSRMRPQSMAAVDQLAADQPSRAASSGTSEATAHTTN